MAGVRDPAFWKRFSTAVHLDEEIGEKNSPKDQDSWLARQQAKKSRRSMICWLFWFAFLGFIAAVVAVIIWVVQSGVLNHIGEASNNSGAGQVGQ